MKFFFVTGVVINLPYQMSIAKELDIFKNQLSKKARAIFY